MTIRAYIYATEEKFNIDEAKISANAGYPNDKATRYAQKMYSNVLSKWVMMKPPSAGLYGVSQADLIDGLNQYESEQDFDKSWFPVTEIK